MNQYITIRGHILELPIFLGIVSLVVVSGVVVLLFFLGPYLKKQSAKKKGLLLLAVSSLVLAVAILINDQARILVHSPTPLTSDFSQGSANPTIGKSSYKYRYTASRSLAKLGFLKAVYDDGERTYFLLNTLNIPVVFIEGANGNLEDQKEYVSVENLPDHPFPVVIANKLSSTWYLQFNGFISHVHQNPTFKPSYDTESVNVFFSDRYFASVKMIKDRVICNENSTDNMNSSVPRIRHYFIFEDIRYYIDDCLADYSASLQEN